MKDFQILLLIIFFIVQKSPLGIQCLIHDHVVLRFCVKHMVLQLESLDRGHHSRIKSSLGTEKSTI